MSFAASDILEEGKWSSIAEQCAALGEMIGLEAPVAEEVLRLALRSKRFAQQLLASRQAPVWRDYLLKNLPSVDDDPEVEALPLDNLNLIARGSKALLRWAHSGFLPATEEMISRREKACLQCFHLRPPEKTLQKIVSTAKFVDEPGERTGNLVCNLCGCGVRNKLRLPTESCPAPHPKSEGYTRWGEEVR
ncbi:MAG: hypothetical protein AAF998_28940 [Bacteroidota bacterium]